MTTLQAPLSLEGSAAFPGTPEIAEPVVVRRIGRILLSILLIAASALILAFCVLHAYIAWKLSHPDVAALASNPMAAKNLAYSDVTFPSADGRSILSGWWIPAESGQSVVLSHGYGANREESWVPMYDLADMLHQKGYNVLMFDYGFANHRHPMPATGGRLESQQLLGAIQFAKQQGSDQLIVWGFSMGAGTALQAALHQAPVDGMILDSTFLPNEDTLYFNLEQSKLKLPKYISMQMIRWFLPIVGGTSLDQIPAAAAQHTSFDFPILLIHGTADNKAPAYLSENVAHAQKNPNSGLWIVKGAIHEMIYRTRTKEYNARIDAFLGEVQAAWFAKYVKSSVVSV
ncbi:alpha/beta fold hydrolase [Cohnella pontilimi]|uniref:Alpha/beta fold hydrolase n=1 Tax=Cohnella pontilimi TaxID=2564100 RepID=A0A4U0FC93_9BACL|nr:alpha/beta fold hydrolase [Cohnella pontilimi]TJY42405.1 alpha/beta fold hydrolase [Cohnella pontilimi]